PAPGRTRTPRPAPGGEDLGGGGPQGRARRPHRGAQAQDRAVPHPHPQPDPGRAAGQRRDAVRGRAGPAAARRPAAGHPLSPGGRGPVQLPRGRGTGPAAATVPHPGARRMRDASPLGHAAASAIGPSSPFPGAVLFDLDGTLVDSAGGIAWALDRTLEDLGHAAVGEALARTWIGEGARTLLRRALAHAGSPLTRDAPGFAQAFERLMHHYDASLPRQARAYPGAEQALRGLRARGIRVALCTNKPERFIDRKST